MITLQHLNSQLTALKTTFDEAISNGSSFAAVKPFYLRIKKLKQKIDGVRLPGAKDGSPGQL